MVIEMVRRRHLGGLNREESAYEKRRSGDVLSVWVVGLAVRLLNDADKMSQDMVLHLLRQLKDASPAVDVEPGRLRLRYSVEASSASAAVDTALEIWEKAACNSPGELSEADLTVLEVASEEEAERRYESEAALELLGVAELAEVLQVSKPRARQVAQRPDFPPPVAILAATTVWDGAKVRRFLSSWPRGRNTSSELSKPRELSGAY